MDEVPVRTPADLTVSYSVMPFLFPHNNGVLSYPIVFTYYRIFEELT